jgi:hypothetical protein
MRGQDVDAVEPHRPFPGQVVEADVVQGDALVVDAEPVGEGALEADGDVAEADCLVSGVQ